MIVQEIVRRYMSRNSAVEDSTFTHFAHASLFNFLTAMLGLGSDREAIRLARELDEPISSRLSRVGDSHIGLGSPTLLMLNHPPGMPTTNTARHVYLLTLLLRSLRDRTNNDETSATSAAAVLSGRGRILEIGGGYGNAMRIMRATYGFSTWTIVVLPFFGRLQRWYTQRTLGETVCAHHECEGDGRPLVRFVSNDAVHRYAFRTESNKIDLLLGTHSWSEMPIEMFYTYLSLFAPKSQFVLYAYHRFWPSEAENDKKVQALMKFYRVVARQTTEDDKAVALVLERSVT